MRERCQTCRFWIFAPPRGLCRRYPPKLSERHNEFLHPAVNQDDWCGEWQSNDHSVEAGR